MRIRLDVLTLLLSLGLNAAGGSKATAEAVSAPEIMDVEVDPGVEDPRGDAAVAPADPREEDKMVCTNVVCGDDEVTRPTCATCTSGSR